MDWRSWIAVAGGVALGVGVWVSLPAQNRSAVRLEPSAAAAPGRGPAAPAPSGPVLCFLLMDGCPACGKLRPAIESAAEGCPGDLQVADAFAEEMESVAERRFRKQLHGAAVLDGKRRILWSAEGDEGMRRALEERSSILASVRAEGGSR